MKKEAKTEIKGEDMKILIVDDNEQNLYMLDMMLTGYGHDVVSAKNGDEALHKLKKDNFNLIISDILMPKMDGFQLCRECKKDEKLKIIPFIFYTATYTEKKDEEFALGLGASRFIVKPAEPEVFIRIIREVMQEADKGLISAPAAAIIKETEFKERYTERVVKKLEKKILQLEEAKKALEEEIAERKQAEEALLESERQLREAQEMAHMGFWSWDVKTGDVKWSEEVFKIFCLDPNEFKPRIDSILALSPWPEDHERDKELVRRAMENHEMGIYEQRFLRPDGSIGYYHSTFQGKYDVNGGLISIVGTVLDITERKRAEEEIALNALRIQFLLDLHQLAFAPQEEILDFTLEASLKMTQSEFSWFGFMDEKESVLNIHRWSKSTMAQCALHEKPLEFKVSEAGLWGDCIRQRKPVVVNDYSAPHTSKKRIPEGHVRIQRFLAVPVFDEARIMAVAAVANKKQEYTDSDVSALGNLINKLWEILRRKQTNQTLALQARISNIFLTTPDDEMYNEVLKIVLEMTRSLFGVFGYIDEAGALVVPTMTRQIWDRCQVPDKTFIFPRDKWGHSSWPQAIRGKNIICTNEPSTNIPVGHVGIQRQIALPILLKGEVVGLFQVANKETNYTEADIRLLKDVAEQVAPILSARLRREQAEEKIRKLNAELEQRVKERTAQLESANKELEAFAYSVSHDLRAPLRAIDGYSRFVLEDYAEKLDDEGRRLLNVIRINTQKMDQLITDILGLSRVRRTEMRLSRIDMNALVNTVYREIASPEIQQKFVFSVEPLPEVFGDPTLIRQVWINLISNAIKYTLPREERRIEIGGRTEGGMNIYCIKDTGVGFNPDYTHKLFGLFQRLHRADEFEGTGVGLAIVQRVIMRHGGKVWAEGKVNEGATFWFSIPIREERDA